MADDGDAFSGVELLVKDGANVRVIATLDEASAYVEASTDGERANREGVLFRLQAAHTPDEKRVAADAFRGWLDATGLLVEARRAL